MAKRDYNTAHKYKLWVDTNNSCPMCGETIINIQNPLETTEDNFKNKQHIGEIAHIISLNNLKRDDVPIRPNNIKYKSIESKHWGNAVKRYKKTYLNHYQNLIILCKKCHLGIDGGKKYGKHPILDKNDEDQILELKSYKKIKSDSYYKEAKIPSINMNDVVDVENVKNTINIIKTYHQESNVIFTFDSYSLDMPGILEHNSIINVLTKLKDIEQISDLSKSFDELSTFLEKYTIVIDFKRNKNIIHAIFSIRLKYNIKTKLEKTNKKSLADKVERENRELGIDWIVNNTKTDAKIKNKPEYNLLKELLLETIEKFSQNESDSFSSYSVAYMARWGTGKTTIIRALLEDLKEFFSVVEINLWHISNSLDENTKDSAFVRQIVKEAVTQLSNNPELVSRYMNSKTFSIEKEGDYDIKRKMLDSLLDIPANVEPKTLIRERAKFLDQHINLISRVADSIFHTTYKPTVFVFDDLDRVEDSKKVVKILDSLVAFLSIKNSIYIIPVDEAKVMKSISSVKIGNDPYSYMNKYFTYSIRAPFIPRLNALSILDSFIDKSQIEEVHDWKLKASQLFPATYRGIKDYMNTFSANKYVLSKNNFFKSIQNNSKINNKKIHKSDIILFSTILQIKFPLLTDYMSEDIKRKDDIFNICLAENKEKKSFLEKLVDFLKNPIIINNDGDHKDWLNKMKEIKSPIINNDFWSSLIGFDLEEKDYENCWTLVNSIQKIENYDKNKKLIVDKLMFLNKIFVVFAMKTINSSGKLMAWTALTLAELDNKQAIEFARDVDFQTILLSDNFEEKLNEFLRGSKNEEN